MNSFVRGIFVIVGVAVLAGALLRSPGTQAAPVARELWLYQGANLADSAALPRIEGVWRRAAAAGYTHVALVDPKFARLTAQDAAYFARVKALRALASSLRLEIVPGVSLVGRA
ncbi:MAG: hypothetical protein IT348_01305, partial [Candidatus Eisenbacteria bacterium]|nr:hypothetical protein [Candidatus Eisenbacteria bacterium]